MVKDGTQVRAPESGTGTKGALVLLIGSRTGGPLIPLLGIKDDLLAVRPDLRFAIIGVKGGFEDRVAAAEGLAIDHLPEVKSPARPTGWQRMAAPILVPVRLFMLGVQLCISTARALRILNKGRPALILSMSNFLSVPVIWANRLRGGNRARVALHQLDIENKTVNLAGRFVDLLTGGLPEICAATGGRFVPNPVRYSRFDALGKREARTALADAGLVPGGEARPVLLVFGGGSGSQFINDWVVENEELLAQHFFVLHLTGYLQNKTYSARTGAGICAREGLTDLMPAALVAADVVVARAGMSTVSELLYLKKNAYLVPIPASHQVANAAAVSSYFRILTQPDRATWLSQLIGDNAASYRAFRSVQWDYYAPGARESYRDALLRLADG